MNCQRAEERGRLQALLRGRSGAVSLEHYCLYLLEALTCEKWLNEFSVLICVSLFTDGAVISPIWAPGIIPANLPTCTKGYLHEIRFSRSMHEKVNFNYKGQDKKMTWRSRLLRWIATASWQIATTTEENVFSTFRPEEWYWKQNSVFLPYRQKA